MMEPRTSFSSLVDNDKPVQRQLLFPLLLVFVLIIIVVIALLYQQQKRALQEAGDALLRDSLLELNETIEEQSRTFLALEKVIMEDAELHRALKERDRAFLLQQYQRKYLHINEQLKVTHFYFHDAELINLLRLHKPERFGDAIKRYTAQQAYLTRKPYWGMELGGIGAFTLRVVSPVIVDNQVLGFIELGSEIEALARSAIESRTAQWVVTLNKNLIDQAVWSVYHPESSWQQFDNVVLVGRSMNTLSNSWEAAVKQLTLSGGQTFINSERWDSVWHVGQLVLRDVRDNAIGQLTIFSDISTQKKALLNTMLWATLSLVALMLLLLIYFYVALRKVDWRIQANKDLLHELASNDVLTGLPNRQLLHDRLAHALQLERRQGGSLAVMFMDLDNFKHINDSYGHSVGDELLVAVTRRLSKFVRSGDTFARNGGDEFVFILQELKQPEDASKVAEKVINACRQPFKLSDVELMISTSIGISMYPQDGDNMEDLLRNADSAMYKAKEKGRDNFVFYNRALTESSLERMTIEVDLRRALKNDELYLCYQPQYSVSGDEITGVEVLSRWNQPEKGFISPGKFIPVAEQCGLIYKIGQWSLRTACEQGKRWLDQGIHFGRISVNLATPQLQDPKLSATIIRILDEVGLPAEYLELEVTESSLMKNMDVAIKHLMELKEYGVFIAVDDFGTGYSSLAYLKRLPLHSLKIDRSFIKDLPGDTEDAIIVNAIIALAKNLGLKVIAEGVETEEQLRHLQGTGCDAIQGYYFHKPETCDVVEQTFLQHRERKRIDN